MSPHDFVSAVEAAEMAGLGVYARAVLGTARDGDAEVLSLRLACTYSDAGVSVIECEFVDASGNAVGGFAL